MIWTGVRRWDVVAGLYACTGVTVATSLMAHRAARLGRPAVPWLLATYVTSSLGFAASSLLVAPFVIAPMAVAVNAIAYATYLDREHRGWVLGVGVGCVLLPFAAPLFGVDSVHFGANAIAITPTVVDLPETPATVLLMGISVLGVVLGVVVVSRLRDALTRVEEDLHTYTWHLRELVPKPPATDGVDSDAT